MGLMEVVSIGRARYTCVFTCDHSSHVWTYFLKSKDKTLKTFKAFVTMIEKLTGLQIKFFRSDRGRKFMSDGFTQFLEEHSITHEALAPQTPQQNGVAERMNQTLLGGACAMVQHTGTTKGFWAKAIGVATHIINHAPRKHLAWRTPYEILFGRVPNVSYLRVFRCRAWVLNNQHWGQRGCYPGGKLRVF